METARSVQIGMGGEGWKEKKVEPLDDYQASFHESLKKEKHNESGRKKRRGWRSTRRKLDLIAVYAAGTYFQTIVKRVGAILTGHSDALTDSPKTKVATTMIALSLLSSKYAVLVLFSRKDRKIRFDRKRRRDCYKKEKEEKHRFIDRGKGGGRRKEGQRRKTRRNNTKLHAPRGRRVDAQNK